MLQYTRGASAGELDWQTNAPSSVKNVAIRAKSSLVYKVLNNSVAGSGKSIMITSYKEEGELKNSFASHTCVFTRLSKMHFCLKKLILEHYEPYQSSIHLSQQGLHVVQFHILKLSQGKTIATA